MLEIFHTAEITHLIYKTTINMVGPKLLSRIPNLYLPFVYIDDILVHRYASISFKIKFIL